MDKVVRNGKNPKWFDVIIQDIDRIQVTVPNAMSIVLLSRKSHHSDPEYDTKIGEMCINKRGKARHRNYCNLCDDDSFRVRAKIGHYGNNCTRGCIHCLNNSPSEISAFRCKISCFKKHFDGELYLSLVTLDSFIISPVIFCIASRACFINIEDSIILLKNPKYKDYDNEDMKLEIRNIERSIKEEEDRNLYEINFVLSMISASKLLENGHDITDKI